MEIQPNAYNKYLSQTAVPEFLVVSWREKPEVTSG
jgi:hypothetical protein